MLRGLTRVSVELPKRGPKLPRSPAAQAWGRTKRGPKLLRGAGRVSVVHASRFGFPRFILDAHTRLSMLQGRSDFCRFLLCVRGRARSSTGPRGTRRRRPRARPRAAPRGPRAASRPRARAPPPRSRSRGRGRPAPAAAPARRGRRRRATSGRSCGSTRSPSPWCGRPRTAAAWETDERRAPARRNGT